MKLAIKSTDKSSIEKLDISPVTFNREFNEPLVHQVITAYLARKRVGTKAQKSRSQVSGGGAKPFKQKGSGRARAGTIRSPLWKGGAKIFAAIPRKFEQKVNKKMYRGAMQSILSELVRQDRFMIIENKFTIDKPKTKLLLNKLQGLEVTDALIVTATWDRNLYLAARNVPKIETRHIDKLDPVSLLKFFKVIMTVDAVRKIEGALK